MNPSRNPQWVSSSEDEELALALAISASLTPPASGGRGATAPSTSGTSQPRPPMQGSSSHSLMPPTSITPPSRPVGHQKWQAGPQEYTKNLSPIPVVQGQQRQHHPPQYYPHQQQQQQQQQQRPSLHTGANVCPGCGSSIGFFGQHVMALGRKWHLECLRCGLCKETLHSTRGTQFAQGKDGLPYHLACHKTKFHPVCVVCNNFIPERPDGTIEFKELQFWRDKMCPHHTSGSGVVGPPGSVTGGVAVVTQCCSCSRYRPVRGPQWVTLGDGGRELCLECVSSIVVDTKDAQPLYQDVLRFYKSMGMEHPHQAPFVLVDSHTLNEYSSKEGRDTRSGGPIFHVRGLCLATVHRSIPTIVRTIGSGFQVRAVSTPLLDRATTTCSVSAILVMYGLPRLLTGCIIAHELMHAWLRMRHVSQLNPQVEEGMCQLMAMLWLDRQHDSLAGDGMQQRLASYFSYQIREDTSAVYGDGFRIAYDAFQRYGGGMRGLSVVINNVLRLGRIE